MIEKIQCLSVLLFFPTLLLGTAFITSAVNMWSMWRAVVGLSFFIVTGICFSVMVVSALVE